jgi:hypothetical protein
MILTAMPQCGGKFKATELAQHKVITCDRRIAKCKFKNCDRRLPFDELQQHQRHECKYVSHRRPQLEKPSPDPWNALQEAARELPARLRGRGAFRQETEPPSLDMPLEVHGLPSRVREADTGACHIRESHLSHARRTTCVGLTECMMLWFFRSTWRRNVSGGQREIRNIARTFSAVGLEPIVGQIVGAYYLYV